MLKELISTKINEIFTEYYNAQNITTGYIDPWDAQRLEFIETSLKELIERVSEYQQKKEIPASFYIYSDVEGIIRNVSYDRIDTDKFFYEISKRIAFDDCSGETILSIFWRGIEVEYVGWQPCMKFEYKTLSGNTVWVGQFEEWDH